MTPFGVSNHIAKPSSAVTIVAETQPNKCPSETERATEGNIAAAVQSNRMPMIRNTARTFIWVADWLERREVSRVVSRES